MLLVLYYNLILCSFLFGLQFTEEILGQAEKTELDPQLEALLLKADKTKQWTEKILKQTESVLQPNPSNIKVKVAYLYYYSSFHYNFLRCAPGGISVRKSTGKKAITFG